MSYSNQLSRNGKPPSLAARVKENLDQIFLARQDAAGDPKSKLDEDGRALLEALVAPLEQEPPESSLAAEAALTIAAFSLTEKNVLNVVSISAGDLEPNGRLAGDRTVGDYLCNTILTPRVIPATKGPFQSSTFRSGYLAKQSRTVDFRKFAEWQSKDGRELQEIENFSYAIVDAFLSSASKVPELPALDASTFTFIKYRQLRDRIMAQGSGGAIEQYLLAGLLEQEMQQFRPGTRVETKSVGANDRSTKVAGDIQVRHGQGLLSAIEVSAADWRSKTHQLTAAADAGLREVTIAATGVHEDGSGDEMDRLIVSISSRTGIDPSVIDLHSYMDVLASRITPHGRAEAIRFLYRCLARYHGRQPALAGRLIDALAELDLSVDSDTARMQNVSEASLRISRTLEALYDELKQLPSEATLAERLREFADSIEKGETRA